MNTAMLLNAAMRRVSGNIGNKDALRAALREAKFDSVRGTFRFNRNHFPTPRLVCPGSGGRR